MRKELQGCSCGQENFAGLPAVGIHCHKQYQKASVGRSS